jgi:phage recombination protein Bet
MSDAISMLFEDVNGQPIPRIPRAKDGTIRTPDGLRYFDTPGGSLHFQRSESELRRLWATFFEDLLARDFSTILLDEMAASGDAEPAPVFDLSDEELLHRVKYGHLAWEQFQYFLAVCRRRRLNPWANEVYARTEHDDRTGGPTLLVIVGISGLRRIAERTGLYGGFDECRFEYGDDPRVPVKATFTGYKMIAGMRTACSASVLWDECAPEAGADWFWDQRPHEAIELRAEAKFLRKAFSEELGDLYTPDEVRRSPRPTSPRGETADAPATDAEGGEAAPTGRMQFEIRAIDLGIKEPSRRAQLIALLKSKHAALLAEDEVAFWGVAFDEIKRNPRRYLSPGMA